MDFLFLNEFIFYIIDIAREPVQAKAPAMSLENFSRLDWKQYALLSVLILAPGFFAINLNIISIIAIRRVIRGSHLPPINPLNLLVLTLITGAVLGVAMQFGFDRLMQWLLGMPSLPELYVVAVVATGIASIGFYEFYRWYCVKKEYCGLYALMSVKHDPGRGHAGETPPDDLALECKPRKRNRRGL